MAMLVVAAFAGCSSGDGDDRAEPAKGVPKAAAAAIDRLERATVDRDFAVICDELFTDAARERAGGDDCAKLLRSTAGDIRDPAIRVISIRIEGDRADVRVSSSARGQRAVEETVELVRDGEEYRIEALGE
jgi:hypothetical protein